MAKFRILIVDDDPDLRDSTADLLRTIDVDVAEASNGHVAFDFIKRNQPDAVVVDLNMPMMSGMTLVELLRKSGYPPSRIVIYSATLDQSRVLRLAQVLKVEHFFVKPVDPTPFLARVRQVVGMPA